MNVTWKKSSRCETSACLEVAVVDGEWHLRDSENPDVVIKTTHDDIAALVAGWIAGDFR